MEDRPKDQRRALKGAGDSREDRLRAALRANLARRKAQARARDQKAAEGDRADNNSDTGKDDS